MKIFPNKPGTINGRSVSTHPISENIINCGIIRTGYGIMTDANKRRKILFFPLKFNLANANAARLEVNVPTIVTDRATIRLFDIPDKSGPIFQISKYLLNDMSVGIHTGGSENTSSFDFREVDTIHNKGAIMTIAPIVRKIKTKISVIRSFFFTDIVSTFSFLRVS